MTGSILIVATGARAQHDTEHTSRMLTLLNTRHALFLDVRVGGDCDATRIGVSAFGAAIPFDVAFDDPDASEMAKEAFIDRVASHPRLQLAHKRRDDILVVCCAGLRSDAAAALLVHHGYVARSLPGGLKAMVLPRKAARKS